MKGGLFTFMKILTNMRNLNQNDEQLIKIPFFNTLNRVEFDKENFNNRENYLLIGYGINLREGLTTYQSEMKMEDFVEDSKGFYTLNKKLPWLTEWLKPNTLFKLFISSLNWDLNGKISTLLYVDSDSNVIVVTKEINRLLRPFFYIWLLTHNLMYIRPFDVGEIKFNLNKEQVEEYHRKKYYNEFISDLQVLILDTEDLTAISAASQKVFIVNVFNYLQYFVEENGRIELLSRLKCQNNIFISLDELKEYRNGLNQIYEQLKTTIRPKYKSFPILKILTEIECSELSYSSKKVLKIVRND